MTKLTPTASARKRAGFSILELLIAVGILLILAVVAIPNMVTVVANSRLRAGMTSMSGLFQNCRMMAVKQNKMLSTHFATPSTALVAYIKDATVTATLVNTDPQIKWSAPVIKVTTPTGPTAPSTLLDATILGFTPQTGDPSFNTRGLPCVYSGGNCTNSGFLYYFKDTSQGGTRGWAAATISPAGRIKRWGWSGTAWTD
jgi:prepilin-type N-terminal cleavage/methylation domain-containing protein